MILSMLSFSWIFVALFPSSHVSITPDTLPEKAKSILENATVVELFSLDPTIKDTERPKEERFHGWLVLGKTKLDGETKKKVLEAVKASIAKDEHEARCFWPRHAIHATNGKQSVDLVICFECQWAYLFYDGGEEPVKHLTTAQDANAILNEVLQQAKIPLPAPPKR
jgi:hypothetical protein